MFDDVQKKEVIFHNRCSNNDSLCGKCFPTYNRKTNRFEFPLYKKIKYDDE